MCAGPRGAAQAAPPEPLTDNSFLIEEAYNQGSGVVQEISNFTRAAGGADWAYSLTQEWPLGGIRHQLSYTIPLEHHAEFHTTGLGDALVNYRYQLVGSSSAARLLVAPRLSVLLPTGSAAAGRGSGAVGLQTNIPVTLVLSPQLSAHLNAGLTVIPSAHDAGSSAATTTAANLGVSAVWFLRELFNPLVELVWFRGQNVAGPGRTETSTQAFLNPGVRWAFNFPRNLQVATGLAYTIGLNAASGDGLFLYLSFEHPFRHTAR